MQIEKNLIFLSYARKDIAAVRELYHQLKTAGYTPWMDVEDLLPGEEWELLVKQTIERAPFFVACLSTHAVSHEGVVQMEFKEALEIAKKKLSSNIYFIPVRLDDCKVPPEMKKYNWLSLNDEDGFGKLLAAIREGLQRRGLNQTMKLRSEPLSNLWFEDVGLMLKKRGFFEFIRNWNGLGILHQYEEINKGGEKVVIDHSTDLTWQQSGSGTNLTFKDAQNYVIELKQRKFAGHNDWRLPTLEEAMSLMEREKNKDGLFIASIFDKKQHSIWTEDKLSEEYWWYVYFDVGYCLRYKDSETYVRAVS